MQKFTRALSREVEVAGVRLAVTFTDKGLSVRPVGSRKEPLEASWAALLCALAGRQGGGGEPGADQLRQAIEALGGAPAGGSREEGVPELLARLEAWLKKKRRRYHKGLLPGASDEALAALAKELGGPVPDGLAAWLRWHDGQNEDLVGCFVESFELMSAAEIAEALKERRGKKGWPSSYVPLLDDHQDDYVVVDSSKPELPVREVWQGRDDHPEVATSMRGWLSSLLADFEADKYHEDPERGELMRESE
jgi:cell wall assembly regulator SMI1